MNHKPFRLFLAILIPLLFAILPLGLASADTGPKPTIEFTFIQGSAGDPLTIVSGLLLQCDSPGCTDPVPLPGNMGPQHFDCEALSCSGLAYGFSDYGQLEITFSDGSVRTSNIFAIKRFNSVYDVTIQPGSLLVKERFNPTPLVIGGVCLSLLAIAAVVLAVFAVKALRPKAGA